MHHGLRYRYEPHSHNAEVFFAWLSESLPRCANPYLEVYVSPNDLGSINFGDLELGINDGRLRVILTYDNLCLEERLRSIRDHFPRVARDNRVTLATFQLLASELNAPSLTDFFSDPTIQIPFEYSLFIDQEQDLDCTLFEAELVNSKNTTFYFQPRAKPIGWFADRTYLLFPESGSTATATEPAPHNTAMFNALVLTLTGNCNVACRHCAPSCKPIKTKPTDVDFFKRVITEAAQVDEIKKECAFVGGEPTIYFPQLISLIGYAAEQGFAPSITTNGWWGKTDRQLKKYLSEMYAAGLRRMELSIDVFHQEFIDMMAVKNILNASREIGIGVVVRAVVSRSGNLANSTHGLTTSDLEGHLIASSPVLPIGRAAEVISTDDFYWSADNDGSCSKALNFTVRYDGVTTPCCVGTDFVPYLHIGNAKDISIQRIFQKYFYSFRLRRLTSQGPAAILQEIKGTDATIEAISSKTCVGMCHLCLDSMSSSRVQQAFDDANKEYLGRIALEATTQVRSSNQST